MCGFQLGKIERSKQITLLKDIRDGSDLENKLIQSKIVILPLNDFPNDLPLVEHDCSSQASTSNPVQSSIHIRQEDNDPDYLEPGQISLNNFSTASQRSTITRPSRSTTIQCRTMENYNFDEEEEEEEEEDGQLSTKEETVNVEKCIVFPSLPEDAEAIRIEILRSHCFHDLMNLYMDEEIVNKNLQVTFLGELGLDGGGLTKELFNIFFIKCESIFFRGEDCLVPYLELSKLNEIDKFVIIGRILQHMLLLTNNLPAKLSRITLMLISKPEKDVNPDILLQELLRYVNPYLRKILKKALKNFMSLTEKENETVQDFFQTNRFFARPSSETLSEQLRIIATEIFIEKSKKRILKIREGVSPAKYADFWNHCDFDVLLDMQTPTATKIVNCLVTDCHLTNEENDILHYFTMYIHCLDKDKLKGLIFLITGSFLMPMHIDIKFNDTVGLSQRPMFSTCTNTITLPKTYANYDDLKNDLNMCLFRGSHGVSYCMTSSVYKHMHAHVCAYVREISNTTI
ncbi:uncharacterized protein LOC120357855 [Solenopsis invicta]|uniref:uncharacterized protein LOC120357855 n=1 Tax=Solenopsis invicta TaxID=13686 RepID=UPI00193D79A0|nr:uncharacterized protein LOC120357855 [Solenopsis invicta]